MEFRGGGMDRAAFEELLTQLRLVSLAEFESALPSSFVTAADRPAAVKAILDGIEGVTGVTRAGRHHPGHEVRRAGPLPAGRRHRRAVRLRLDRRVRRRQVVGDQARADEAARVMGTSRQWPVLQEMDPEGDYPEVVWEYADAMAAGQVPEGYVEGLGCTTGTPTPR